MKILQSYPALAIGHVMTAILALGTALGTHGALGSGVSASADAQTAAPLIVAAIGMIFSWLIHSRVFSPATVERIKADAAQAATMISSADIVAVAPAPGGASDIVAVPPA